MTGLDFDLSAVDPGVQAALLELVRKKWQLRALQAQAEQESLARGGILQAKAINGVGAVTRRVHSFAYHDWALKLGSYDCWQDNGFNKYMDRIAPETKVRCTGTRPQVGWRAPTNGAASELVTVTGGHKRFTKSYG